MNEKNFMDRSWETRVSSMPRIPRGNGGYIDSLRIILNAVANGNRPNSVVEIPGSNSKRTLEQDCVGLRPSGFVKSPIGAGNWELTDISKEWLKNKNNDYLAIYMNGQIKFFSEILNLREEQLTSRKIYEHATNDYKMAWKQESQIFERTSWLRDFGYLEYIDFNSTFKITEKGLSFLKAVTPYDFKKIKSPSEFNRVNSINISDLDSNILNIVPKNQKDFESRIHTMGYTPGPNEDILNVINGYLELVIDNRVSIKSIIDYSKKTYSIKESSIRGFLSQLTISGLFERVSSEEYEITKYGQMLLEDDNIIDLAIYFHARYLFFFEILAELKKKPLNAKEIINEGTISYGLAVEGEITKRISILKTAKLLYLDRGKYHISPSGEYLLKNIKVQSPKVFTKTDDTKTEESSDSVEKIMSELIVSSRDSMNPDRFEKAIYQAFLFLGFKAKWIGRSGNTDVFIQTSNIPELSYKVNIDAKSTYSGPVSDSQVDFDTLNEHKAKMNADYVIIVGNEFDNGRLMRRAEEHKVGLLSVDQLNELIKNHLQIPVTFEEYKKFFEQIGIMNSSVLQPARDSMVYQGNLIKVIVKNIYEKNETERIDVNVLHWILKKDDTIKRVPTNKEIEDILDFLSSPLVSCIVKTKDNYYPNGSLADTVLKLRFYGDQLSE